MKSIQISLWGKRPLPTPRGAPFLVCGCKGRTIFPTAQGFGTLFLKNFDSCYRRSLFIIYRGRFGGIFGEGRPAEGDGKGDRRKSAGNGGRDWGRGRGQMEGVGARGLSFCHSDFVGKSGAIRGNATRRWFTRPKTPLISPPRGEVRRVVIRLATCRDWHHDVS